jgi:hypothetical protein
MSYVTIAQVYPMLIKQIAIMMELVMPAIFALYIALAETKKCLTA